MSDHEDEGGHERWLVSYADFMTLLFAFFTVLYATSEKNAEKTQAFQESVKKYLIKAGGSGAGGVGPSQINQGDQHNTVIEPPIKTFRDHDKSEAAAPLENAEAFVEDLTPEERRRYVSDLSSDDWGVRLTLPAAPLFDAGSDKFRPDAMAFLKKLGALIVKSKRRAVIESHAAFGERGQTRSPWDFAAGRAVNILRFIERAAGVAPGQLAATSFGDARPAFKEGDPKRNARVDVVLLNPDVPL